MIIFTALQLSGRKVLPRQNIVNRSSSAYAAKFRRNLSKGGKRPQSHHNSSVCKVLLSSTGLCILTDAMSNGSSFKSFTKLLVINVFVFVHIYPPFTRKRIVSLYFGRDVRTRLGVAIFGVSGPSVLHIKTEATR